MVRVSIAILVVVIGAISTTAGAASRPDSPCTAAQTRALVLRLTRAWTRGDVAAADRLVAREPAFRWLSVAWAGVRVGSRASDRSTLRGYFAARRRQHDRVVLQTFRFHGSDVRGRYRYGHYEFTAYRDADDWPETIDHVRSGKGAIVCSMARPAIAVFTIG